MANSISQVVQPTLVSEQQADVNLINYVGHSVLIVQTGAELAPAKLGQQVQTALTQSEPVPREPAFLIEAVHTAVVCEEAPRDNAVTISGVAHQLLISDAPTTNSSGTYKNALIQTEPAFSEVLAFEVHQSAIVVTEAPKKPSANQSQIVQSTLIEIERPAQGVVIGGHFKSVLLEIDKAYEFTRPMQVVQTALIVDSPITFTCPVGVTHSALVLSEAATLDPLRTRAASIMTGRTVTALDPQGIATNYAIRTASALVGVSTLYEQHIQSAAQNSAVFALSAVGKPPTDPALSQSLSYGAGVSTLVSQTVTKANPTRIQSLSCIGNLIHMVSKPAAYAQLGEASASQVSGTSIQVAQSKAFGPAIVASDIQIGVVIQTLAKTKEYLLPQSYSRVMKQVELVAKVGNYKDVNLVRSQVSNAFATQSMGIKKAFMDPFLIIPHRSINMVSCETALSSGYLNPADARSMCRVSNVMWNVCKLSPYINPIDVMADGRRIASTAKLVAVAVQYEDPALQISSRRTSYSTYFRTHSAS